MPSNLSLLANNKRNINDSSKTPVKPAKIFNEIGYDKNNLPKVVPLSNMYVFIVSPDVNHSIPELINLDRNACKYKNPIYNFENPTQYLSYNMIVFVLSGVNLFLGIE